MAARLPVLPALAGPGLELVDDRLPGASLLPRNREGFGVCCPPQIDADLTGLRLSSGQVFKFPACDGLPSPPDKCGSPLADLAVPVPACVGLGRWISGCRPSISEPSVTAGDEVLGATYPLWG
jgi:hypothetical protein